MRPIAIVISLLLSSVLFAETQEQVYSRALEAEKAGDIPKSVALFEEAAQMDGEYTKEIQEILKDYYDVLGMSEGQEPWSFRFLGDLGYIGLHYEEYGGIDAVKENGGDIFTSVAGFVDFSLGDWIHSVGVAFVADWFIANKDMPVLDTSDWTLAPGLEYSLVGKRFLLDVGVDFNLSSEANMEPAFYGWLEVDIARFEKQRLGLATWAYYHDGGPLSVALYGSWHRAVPTGFNGNVYVGVKYEADSLSDFLGFIEKIAFIAESSNDEAEGGERNVDCQRDFYGNCIDSNPWGGYGYGSVYKPFEYYMDLCYQDHGEECFDLYNGLVSSYMYADMQQEEGEEEESITLDYSWARWLGPAMRSTFSYKFKTKISLEAKLNLFYGYMIDGPSAEYEKLQKFSGTWGLSFNWNPGLLTLYAGVEQIYLHYKMPKSLVGVFPENSFLSEVKAGVKFEL